MDMLKGLAVEKEKSRSQQLQYKSVIVGNGQSRKHFPGWKNVDEDIAIWVVNFPFRDIIYQLVNIPRCMQCIYDVHVLLP